MKVRWLSEKQRSYPALWETTLPAFLLFSRAVEKLQVSPLPPCLIATDFVPFP